LWIDDSLSINSNRRIPIYVDAGRGNDTVIVSGGSAILLGGDGNDFLIGGPSRDLLIGGGASDILIGGTTSFDDDQAALSPILAQWNSPAPMAARKAGLTDGDGQFVAPLGVSLQQDVTVFGDNHVDHLFGSSNLSWLFFDPSDFVPLPRSCSLNGWRHPS
jgi:Ca2+-binding RTX toxin-like protein